MEIPSSAWRPLKPESGAAAARRLAFVDGVRRIDARLWVEPEGGPTRMGICASWAAGSVEAGGRAGIGRVEVRRGLLTPAAVEPLTTGVGMYAPVAVAGDAVEQLSLGLQQRLGELEIEVAGTLAGEPDLVVVDGPLSGRQNVRGAVGYVKTHRVAYLDAELERVIRALEPGERTPLFLTTTGWSRFSCYLRLPGPLQHAWSGIVRLEISGDAAVVEARRLSDLAAATLPRYASTPHKDPRAPQNLFPIGGLERALRHRLGEPALVLRALRAAAAVPA